MLVEKVRINWNILNENIIVLYRNYSVDNENILTRPITGKQESSTPLPTMNDSR